MIVSWISESFFHTLKLKSPTLLLMSTWLMKLIGLWSNVDIIFIYAYRSLFICRSGRLTPLRKLAFFIRLPSKRDGAFERIH